MAKNFKCIELAWSKASHICFLALPSAISFSIKTFLPLSFFLCSFVSSLFCQLSYFFFFGGRGRDRRSRKEASCLFKKKKTKPTTLPKLLPSFPCLYSKQHTHLSSSPQGRPSGCHWGPCGLGSIKGAAGQGSSHCPSPRHWTPPCGRDTGCPHGD